MCNIIYMWFLCILLCKFIFCQENTKFNLDHQNITEEPVSKIPPKFNVVFVPPIFGIIGLILISISVLTTIICVAYCIFLPWTHALSISPDETSSHTSNRDHSYLTEGNDNLRENPGN